MRVRYSKKVPNRAQIETAIMSIESLRDRAIFSILYVTGARVSEVTRRLTVADIEVKTEGNRAFSLFRLQTEKRKKNVIRILPIPYDSHKAFIDTINNYIKGYDLKQGEVLFTLSRNHIYRLAKEELGLHPHFLRHTRTSHLAELGFTEQELRTWGGWTDTRPISIYTHLNWRSMTGKL